jgi:DNA invertase Pin-like site-specific DNA recombinase
MLIGYARTSTNDQNAGLEAQLRDLRECGCERLFDEQVSSMSRRDKLDEAIQYLRDGDVLVVTKLDRLARSVADLVGIVAEIERRGASLRILAMNLDTHTPTGKLMLNVIGSVAQFEREIMLERQREGIQKAKNEGKYKGRKPSVRLKRSDIEALKVSGMTTAEIARQLKVARSSIYRVMGDE